MVANMRHSEDRRERPTYSVAEAALYLNVPASTLRSWFYGREYQTKRDGRKWFDAVIEPADPDGNLLSFYNLVEAHVLSSTRADHRIRLADIRSAVEYLREHFPRLSRPLLSWDFYTNGKDLFIKHLEETINASRQGQVALGAIVDPYLELIERDNAKFPLKLYLAATGKRIAVSPGVRAGRPVIAGTGIPVAIVQQRSRAVETADELAKDYGIAQAQIEAAISFRETAA
jgi:uncharacterized protein (DUF433 family)